VEITEVRIKLMEDNSGSNERLQAFCSITFDDMFVIRDLKIIEGAKGFFVAMPSRKLTDRCPNCGMKNHLRSRFCNQCGSRLDENRAIRDAEGRAKLHADIAHPINSAPGAAAAGGGHEPPLRRGPLRSHTQHSRGNQSVLRGPHVPPRAKDGSAEGIGSSDRETTNGFGAGL
jgi:stage V sporulation protein G